MHSPINVVMKQQRDGAINKAYGHTRAGARAGLNITWNGMGLKGVVLWIFDSKMGNKCTIMKRCSIFSIFQRDNFGNKE